MSDGLKHPRHEAQTIAQHVLDSLEDLCSQIQIAGSLRRQKSMVGDIEIVCQPDHAPTFLARLDNWILTGKARKAIYPDGKQRWGDKYRGLILSGQTIKVEVFLADRHNWGYLFWLRTGPGDANHYVMSRLNAPSGEASHAPYKPSGGCWRDGQGRMISVENEMMLFRLIGITRFIPPEHRSLGLYQRLLSTPVWAEESEIAYAIAGEATQQMDLL